MTIHETKFGIDVPYWGDLFPRIRLARPDEMDVLIVMCKRLHAENGKGPEMDEALVRQEIQTAFYGDQRRGACVVVGDNGEIHGSLMLFLNHLWYNANAWQIEDRWLFVDPQYRDTNNVTQLLEFALWWKDFLGIPLCLSIVANQRAAAKMRLYRKTLGEAAGGIFWIEPTQYGASNV